MKLFKFKVPLTYSKNIFKNTVKNFEVIQIQSNFKNWFCYSASLEPLILTICYIIPFLNPSLDLVSLFRFFGTLILRIFYVVLLLWNPLFHEYVKLFRFFGTNHSFFYIFRFFGTPRFKNLFRYSASLEPLISRICYIFTLLWNLSFYDFFTYSASLEPLILRICYVIPLLWNPSF